MNFGDVLDSRCTLTFNHTNFIDKDERPSGFDHEVNLLCCVILCYYCLYILCYRSKSVYGEMSCLAEVYVLRGLFFFFKFCSNI